jgi:DNA-directed RNA polymerase specialized sigma24 family protein
MPFEIAEEFGGADRSPTEARWAAQNPWNFGGAGTSQRNVDLSEERAMAGEDQREVERVRARALDFARDHGETAARVCMALLGDADEAARTLGEALAEAALEHPRQRGEENQVEHPRQRGEENQVEDHLRAEARSVYPAGSERAFVLGHVRRACARRLEARPVKTAPLGPLAHGHTLAEETPGARLRASLATLRPTEREALLLRLVGGLTVEEVAESTGTTVADARARIGRALARLAANKSSGTLGGEEQTGRPEGKWS